MKVHFITLSGSGTPIRTACGRNGWLDSAAPRLGHPAEYDDEACERFEATPFAKDVTCGNCRKKADWAIFEDQKRR